MSGKYLPTISQKIENISKKWVDINDIKEVPLAIKEGLTNVPIHERVGWECFKKDLAKK